MYSEDYFQARESAVDTSEYVDILVGLRAVGVGPYDVVMEVGAGTGGLIKFLHSRGFTNVFGCDPYTRAPGIMYCRLPDEVPPADVYVFQHVLEHVGDIEGSVKALSRAWAVVGVLPGHLNEDETHVVNFFHHHLDGTVKGLFGEVRIMSIDTVRQLFNKYGYPHVVVTPDTHSYFAPWDNDWLLIASKKPINTLPIRMHMLGTALRLTLRLATPRIARGWLP